MFGYGKVFSKMYEGSMVGAGGTIFALWPYCIAKADPCEHTVELNPKLIAPTLGITLEEVQEAIDFLCAPDPESHCELEGGARLVRQQGHTYFLVTHEAYRNIKSQDDKRTYDRERKRRQRAKIKELSQDVRDTKGHDATSVSVSVSVSGKKGECEGKEGPELPLNEETKPRPKPKAKKKAYGEFQNVRLTDDEYRKLKDAQGEHRLMEAIEILGDWKETKGKANKSDYAAMKANSWVWERVKLARPNPNAKKVARLDRPAPGDRK